MSDAFSYGYLSPTDAERAGCIRTDSYLAHRAIRVAPRGIPNRCFKYARHHGHFDRSVPLVQSHLFQIAERRRVCPERRDFVRNLLSIEVSDFPNQGSHFDTALLVSLLFDLV
jgi:hypothetical protein